MISIELPEIEEQEVTLTRQLRNVRGRPTAGGAAEQLEGYLAIGVPWTRALQPGDPGGGPDSDDDEQLTAEDVAHADFYLVHLAATFRAPPEEAFDAAFLQLNLTRPDALAPEPIAWSMHPERLTTPRSLSRTVDLTASLKIFGVGVAGKVAQSNEHDAPEPFVQAMYEGLPNPAWALRRTSSVHIEGLQRFTLVVRTGRGAETHGTATLRATVLRKHLGIVPYRAALSESGSLGFTLPARGGS